MKRVWMMYVGSRRILYCKLDLPDRSQLLPAIFCWQVLQIGVDLLKCPQLALHSGCIQFIMWLLDSQRLKCSVDFSDNRLD